MSSPPWPLSLLGSAVGWLASLFARIIGTFLIGLLRDVMQLAVIPLLQNTLFHPFVMTGSGFVATVLGYVWHFMVIASGGVALVSLVWGTFRRLSTAAVASRVAWTEVAEGFGMYVLVLVGGWVFLSSLLSMANTITLSLLSATQGYLTQLGNPTFGTTSVALGTVLFTYIFFPLVGFALAAVLLWAVVQWLMRQVDLVFFAGLLPITAALSLSGNKTAFTWAWQETMGALFSQLSMAVAWWVAWLFLSGGAASATVGAGTSSVQLLSYSGGGGPLRGGGTAYAPPVHAVTMFTGQTTPLSLLHLAVGIVAFTLVPKAPQMLQSITGHQHATVGGLAMGVAAGSLMASAGRSVMGGTRAGAAISRTMKNRQEIAEGRAAQAGGQKTLGQRFLNSSGGKSLVAGFSKGQKAVGQAINRLPTPLAQGINGAAGGIKRTAKRAANSTVGRGVRTGMSMMYQPQKTLGSVMNKTGGVAMAARNVTTGAQLAAGTAVIGSDAVRRQTGLKAEPYMDLAGMTSSTEPIGFKAGAFQSNVYKKSLPDQTWGTPREQRVIGG